MSNGSPVPIGQIIASLRQQGKLPPKDEVEKPILSMIREVVGYDIKNNRMLVRYDVFIARPSLADSEVVGFDAVYDPDDPSKGREKAVRLLDDELRKRGVKWSDLRRLPLPNGVHKARYLEEANG